MMAITMDSKRFIPFYNDSNGTTGHSKMLMNCGNICLDHHFFAQSWSLVAVWKPSSMVALKVI